MEKLERLVQNGNDLSHSGSEYVIERVRSIGKIITITVQHPGEISDTIDEMAGRDSVLIPKYANAYVASDFNP